MKTIVITGASSGIGRALALRAARGGMAVIGVARDAARLAALRDEASRSKNRIETIVADVGEAGAAARIVAFALQHGGGIDVLVNNAGAATAGELVAQSDAALRQQFATHVIGPVAIVREALAALQASRGHVVMVGSGAARVAVDGLGAYSPAKAALRSATSILRRELRRHGIAVTYVDPGVVDTPFMERAGLEGAPKGMRISSEVVARKIWHALVSRPRELNAVPWQTAAVSLGEHFPRITDAVLSHNPRLVGIRKTPEAAPPSVIPSGGAHGAPESRDREAVEVHDTIETALEAHARRMERSGLRMDFVRELLVPGARLELGEIAMRWAGMPNKHERALTQEVLKALEAAGYLEADGDDVWVVSGKCSTIS
jgi:short-subunit dehydrogenase